ncbi:MAG: prepilin-type N-terminal cleavage/methylation domain-containing protein [Verrucomicrobiota bacterium]|nr:prepilin-type N-terminal cleavage/methylation domain-containing protein [Verrucomicrobiota bacterium]
MHSKDPCKLHKPAGFTLLEVILATSLFALVIVGFAQIMSKSIEIHQINLRERMVMNALQNNLETALASERLLPGKTVLSDGEYQSVSTLKGVVFKSDIEMAQIKNQRDEILNGMYRVKITAQWDEGEGQEQEREAEVYVYRP